MIQTGYFKIIVILGFLFGIVACNTSNNKNNEVNVDTIKDYSEERLDEAFDRAVIVFYALPSPIETARLFKRAGATFDEALPNQLSNSEKYISNKALALNLGIYSADLSYANLFDQSQLTISYFAVTKKLAENLGILEALNDSVLEKIKTKISDRDYVMGVISDVFMNSQSYLKENHRPEVSSMIVVGGWVEGLYIGVKLAENKSQNKMPIIEAVADQNLSVSDLLSLLEVYKDNPDIASLIKDVESIKVLLSELKKEDGTIDMAKFSELAIQIEKIRSAYIQ